MKSRKENQFLKNRFDQIQSSYNDIEKELDDVKKQFGEELAETRNEYEKVQSKLEHLRENNDLLKKMGKIIVEKYETNNKANNTPEPKTRKDVHREAEENIEIIDTEEVTIEDVSEAEFADQLLTNKIRGFRRTNPAQQASKPKQGSEKPKAAASASVAASEPKNTKQNEKKLFAHFFNNSGKCSHVEV